MSLEFGGSQNNQSNNSHLAGTFINIPTILSARSLAGEDIFKNGKPVDCGIEVVIDVGKTWYPKWRVNGNFKEEDGKMGWGSAFIVREFLSSLGISGTLNDDGHVPEEILQSLVGRKFVRLSYVRGYDANAQKKRYGDYRFIASVENFDDPAQIEKAGKKLTEKFVRDVKSGRVRDFEPNAGETQFP